MDDNLEKFGGSNASAIRKLNRMVDTLIRLNHFVGDGLIKVSKTANGYTLTLDVNQVQARMPKTTSNINGLRKAYSKAAAGAATTATCHLDTDGTGTEVTVNFEIWGGGNLNGAYPQLVDGSPIKVTKIGANWECVSPTFFKIGDGLALSGTVLVVAPGQGIHIVGGLVEVDIDTDQFQFDGASPNGELQTKLDEC